MDHPDIGWRAVIISAEIQFAPRDWQGTQPLSVEDIADTAWVDHMGRETVMWEVLTRVMV